MSLRERCQIAQDRRQDLVPFNSGIAASIAVVVYALSSMSVLEGWLGDSLGKLGLVLAMHLFLAASIWPPWVIMLPLLLIAIGLPHNETDLEGVESYGWILYFYIPIELALMALAWGVGRLTEVIGITMRWAPLAMLIAGLTLVIVALGAQDPGDTYLVTNRDFFAALAGLALGAGAIPVISQLRDSRLRAI